jgi:hypothetical protein
MVEIVDSIPLGSNRHSSTPEFHGGNKNQISTTSISKEFGNIHNITEFRKRVESFTEKTPNHDKFDQVEHTAKLKAMAYFFKVYNSKIDKQLQNARHLIEKYAGKDKLSNLFGGRAALFESGGKLEKYSPLIHELANMAQNRQHHIHGNNNVHHHEQEFTNVKGKRDIKDAIALIEEHIENGLIEIGEMTVESTNIDHLVNLDPLKEQRKINSENEYFRNYGKKKMGLKKRKTEAAIADELHSVAKGLQHDIYTMKDKLAVAERANQAIEANKEKNSEELSKDKKKENVAKEMGQKAKEQQIVKQKRLKEVKKQYDNACKALEDLQKEMEKTFENKLCYACSNEINKVNAGKYRFNCDCHHESSSLRGGSSFLEENTGSNFRKKKNLELVMKDTNEDKISSEKTIIDFEIVPLSATKCSEYGGKLVNNTECRKDSSKEEVHKYLYMFGPKASSRNTNWVKTDGNVVQLRTKFSQFSVAEINVIPNTLYQNKFHWNLPKGKHVEIEMQFEMQGVPNTRCNSLSLDAYDVDITTAQQQGKFDEHNPFFDGDLSSGLHKMSWSKSKLQFIISNYSLGKMQNTVEADPDVVSVRVPYKSKSACSVYNWDPQRAGRLEVKVYPFKEISCKLKRASECAVKLTKDPIYNDDGKVLSPRLCTLLKKVKIPALKEKVKTLCPQQSARKDDDGNDRVQQQMLEETEKKCENAATMYKNAKQDAAVEKIAVEATETLKMSVVQKEEKIEDDANKCDGNAKDDALNIVNKPCPTMKPEEVKKLKNKIDEKEKELIDVENKEDNPTPAGYKPPPKAKDKIICILGQDGMTVKLMKAEEKGKPGSNGGPNNDGDPNSADVDAEKQWPNGEPPAAAPLKAAIVAAHTARIQAWKSANGAAAMLAGAGGTELGKNIASGLTNVVSKVGRLAGAMAGGLAITQWMGKESAPWIYNGRSETLCKMHIVEKKDWCNRKNNDVLEKCGVPDRISATICEIVLNFVTDPGIETSLKNPPPVGIGPAPPFVMPNCMKQGTCQKPCGDDIVMDMMDSFKEEVKKLVKTSASIGTAMAKGAAAAAGAAAAMAFLEEIASENEDVKQKMILRKHSLRKIRDRYDNKVHQLRYGTNKEELYFHRNISNAITTFIEDGVTAGRDGEEVKGGIDAAIDYFGKAVLNGYAAEVAFRKTHVDLDNLKLSEAEGAGDGCLAAKIRKQLQSSKGKLQLAEKHQKEKLGLPDELKKQAKKMKEGAKPTKDRTFKFDVPFGDMTGKYECPKLSIFGCGCGSLPGYETLDGPDCKAMKAILAAEKKWDQKKVDAENFYNKGLGEMIQMAAKTKESEAEGNLLEDGE